MIRRKRRRSWEEKTMILDSYWKKRFKLAEREKAKARADLACEKWKLEEREALLNELTDRNYQQGKAIQAYKKELDEKEETIKLQGEMLRVLQGPAVSDEEKLIPASVLEKIIRDCAGEIIDKSSAFIVTTIIRQMPAAEAGEG